MLKQMGKHGGYDMSIAVSIASSNSNPLDACRAGDLMTRALLVAHADWSVNELAQFLVSNGISGAPVVDQRERVLGVVSVTDIARHASMAEEERDLRDRHHYYTDALDFSLDDELMDEFGENEEDVPLVRDIMTPAIFDVDVNASIRDVSQAMVKNRIHRVLVSEDGRVVGIVSALDILALANRDR